MSTQNGLPRHRPSLRSTPREPLRRSLPPSDLLTAEYAYWEIPDVVVEDDERLVCRRGKLADLTAPEEAAVVIDVFTQSRSGHPEIDERVDRKAVFITSHERSSR